MHQQVQEAKQPQREPEISTAQPADHASQEGEQKAVRYRDIEPWIAIARHPLVLDHRIAEGTIYVAEQS